MAIHRSSDHAPRQSRSATPSAAQRGRTRIPPAGLQAIQAVAGAVPEAVIVTAPDGAVRLTNDAADRLFAGRPVADREDLIARFEPVVVDAPLADASTAPTDAADDGLIVRQRSRPDRCFALQAVPLGSAEPDTGDQAIAFVLRDITESHDLRPVREAFLGLVSHELRTPITTIYAGSTVLARQPGLSAPATRLLAQDVSAEAARLYDVVEDLLVLARIERGVLDPLAEPVRIDRLVESTIRVARDRHPGVRITRRGPLGGVVARCDATYADQALRDLALALIRRPGSGPTPHVEVELRLAPDGESVEIALRDEGPPLPRSELARTFELPDATAAPPAFGAIGLYVARQIVEAMGGRAWAQPTGGPRGIEVGLALPVDPGAGV